LLDPDGEAIQVDGLWALKFGNGGQGGDPNTLYFTAGLGHEGHGLFGSLAAVAPGTPEGPAEEQMVIAALDIFQIAQTAVINDIISKAPRDQLQKDLQALQTAFNDLLHVGLRFEHDEAREGWTDSGKALKEVLDAIFAEYHRH
jgi:hypothetical protein